MNAMPQNPSNFDPSRERRTQIVGQLIAKNNGLPCPHLQVTALLQGLGGARKLGVVRADASGRFALALQTPAPRYGEQQAIFLDVADSSGQLVGRSQGIAARAGAHADARLIVECMGDVGRRAATGQQLDARSARPLHNLSGGRYDPGAGCASETHRHMNFEQAQFTGNQPQIEVDPEPWPYGFPLPWPYGDPLPDLSFLMPTPTSGGGSLPPSVDRFGGGGGLCC